MSLLVLVFLSASVEIFSVSRMQDFSLHTLSSKDQCRWSGPLAKVLTQSTPEMTADLPACGMLAMSTSLLPPYQLMKLRLIGPGRKPVQIAGLMGKLTWCHLLIQSASLVPSATLCTVVSSKWLIITAALQCRNSAVQHSIGQYNTVLHTVVLEIRIKLFILY